ncbi:hypothetical protein F444_11547, partial [Phytophthora nicotianae P1976]
LLEARSGPRRRHRGVRPSLALDSKAAIKIPSTTFPAITPKDDDHLS